MGELIMLGRCPTCNQPRVEAAVCECGEIVQLHQLDEKGKRGKCYRWGCVCREYVEAVADG